MESPSKYQCVTLRNILIVTVLLLHTCESADPVYTPPTLTDTSGNLAFSNATIIWTDLPSGEGYASMSVSRVSEGLEAFYNMVHGFIALVLPKGIPDDIVDKLLDGKTGDIASNYSDYTSFLIGYAICLVLGLLFILVFPIIACCFCCCRCACQNCGGKMTQSLDDANNTCKKGTFTIALLIITAFLITGAVCILLNNDATSTAVNDLPKNTVSNLKDLKVYVNNTVLEATHLIQNNYNFLNSCLNRDLNNIAYLVGLPLRTDVETNTRIRTAISNAYSLVTSLDNADAALSDMESKETSLRSSVTTMETSLDTVKTNLDNIFTTCGGSCSSTGKPDYATEMTARLDSNNFPDLSGPRSSMNSAKATNMTAKLVEVETELDEIPDTVVNDSRTTIDDIRQKTSNLSDKIDPIMNQITDINKLFVGTNATIDLDKLSDDVTDFGETIEEYDKWYGGLSLAGIVLVFVLLMAGGLALGIFGSNTTTHPGNRTSISNCGGTLLIICAYLIFIFSVFLMILTTLTFMIGAPVHRLVCVPITDLDKLRDLVQIYNDHDVGAGKYFLGKLVLDNDTIPLTLSGMLRDCRDGNSAFASFKMAHKFDLNDLLNYSKTVDVQAEIDSVNINLSSVKVYTSDLQTQLSDLKSAININFTKFYIELAKTPTEGNLGALADSIDTYASGLTAVPTTKAALEAEATNIRNIESTEYADVTSKINELNTSLANMESTVSSIPTQVDTLDLALNTTDAYIQTSTSTVIRHLLNTYASRLLSIADSFKNHTRDGIQNQMGNCVPVWNLYNSLLIYTFCFNLMDTFNGFWFSLGWSVFFSILGLIFSVKLAKYYRRMTDMEYTGRESITPAKMFDNKVYPELGPVPTKTDLWDQREHEYTSGIQEVRANTGTLSSFAQGVEISGDPAHIDSKLEPYQVGSSPREESEKSNNNICEANINSDSSYMIHEIERTKDDTMQPNDLYERGNLTTHDDWNLNNVTPTDRDERSTGKDDTNDTEILDKSYIIHVAPVVTDDLNIPYVDATEMNNSIGKTGVERQNKALVNEGILVGPEDDKDETINKPDIQYVNEKAYHDDSERVDEFVSEVLHKIIEENAFKNTNS